MCEQSLRRHRNNTGVLEVWAPSLCRGGRWFCSQNGEEGIHPLGWPGCRTRTGGFGEGAKPRRWLLTNVMSNSRVRGWIAVSVFGAQKRCSESPRTNGPGPASTAPWHGRDSGPRESQTLHNPRAGGEGPLRMTEAEFLIRSCGRRLRARVGFHP